MGSNYVLGSDGELYHWQLKDHKYIKREWKGGKWNYTYPSDPKAATGGNAGGGVVTPKVSKEYAEEVAYNSQKNTISSNSQTTKTSTPKVNPVVSKQISTGQRVLSGANTGSGTATAKVSKEYAEEVAYNSQKNTISTSSQAIKKNSLSDRIAEIANKTADTAKKWANNLFEGYQDEAKEAKAQWDEAKDYVRQLDVEARQLVTQSVKDQRTLNDARRDYQNNRTRENQEKVHEAYQELKDTLQDLRDTDSSIAWYENYADRKEAEYREAMNHPLKKLDDWISKITGETKAKTEPNTRDFSDIDKEFTSALIKNLNPGSADDETRNEADRKAEIEAYVAAVRQEAKYKNSLSNARDGVVDAETGVEDANRKLKTAQQAFKRAEKAIDDFDAKFESTPGGFITGMTMKDHKDRSYLEEDFANAWYNEWKTERDLMSAHITLSKAQRELTNLTARSTAAKNAAFAKMSSGQDETYANLNQKAYDQWQTVSPLFSKYMYACGQLGEFRKQIASKNGESSGEPFDNVEKRRTELVNNAQKAWDELSEPMAKYDKLCMERDTLYEDILKDLRIKLKIH